MFGVCLKKDKKILLLGGSGNLGRAIIKSRLFKFLYYPSRKKLNILDNFKIKRFLQARKIDLVINCAAMARVVDCENIPKMAFMTNVDGTENLIFQIKKAEKYLKKKIKLIHLSSDAVYPGEKGNYKESDKLLPYNTYGWSKLFSEISVKSLSKYIIIRTRFFDGKKIKFKKSATDIFTSKIEVNNLVEKIKYFIDINFNGVINVGCKRHSDFKAHKKFKPSLKPCKRKEIIENLNVKLANDCSMNLKLFNKLDKKI